MGRCTSSVLLSRQLGERISGWPIGSFRPGPSEAHRPSNFFRTRRRGRPIAEAHYEPEVGADLAHPDEVVDEPSASA
jgi:hypothetical protein